VRRVLVVDDEADLQTVLSIALEMRNYRPVIAGDGEEAVQRLRQALAEGEPFHVMLLDMAMPKVDGWHVLRQVRRDPQLKHLPIVAVTGKVTSLDERSRLAAYGAIFVDKRNRYVERVLEVLAGLCGPDGAAPEE